MGHIYYIMQARSGAELGYQLWKIPQDYLWLGQVGRWVIISDQSLVVFNN